MSHETARFTVSSDDSEVEASRALAIEEAPASLEFSNPVVKIERIPGLPRGFYNAAACKINEATLLLGRYAEYTGEPGGPDIGPLALAVLKRGVVESYAEVWQPEGEDKLEDPRMVVLPDGRIFVAFSRLAPYKGGYLPFPAVAITTAEALLRREFPDTHLITGLGTGDQTTPIGTGPNMFHLLPGKNAMPLRPNQAMFRREIDSHRFVIFSLNERGVAKELQSLEIPQESIPYWGESRMGLTMPPAWIDGNQNEAILLIHGFNKPDGRLRYNIGTSRLFVDETGRYAIDNVSEEPLFTPELFAGMFPGEPVQRHPDEREAYYLCGGIPIYDAYGTLQRIDSLPSLGDLWTLKATLSAAAITENWRRD